MSGHSTVDQDAILNATVGGTAYQGPAAGFIALVTVPVLGSDDGTTIVEPTYIGYARMPFALADWEAAGEGRKVNKNPLEWPECTAGEDLLVGWAYCTTEATKSGLVVVSGRTPNSHVKPEIIPRFKPGQLIMRLKNG